MGTVATTCDERAGLFETRDDAGARRPAVRVVLGFACAAILGIFGTALAAPGLLRLDATALGGAPAETAVKDDPLAENDLFHAAGVSFAASHAGRHPETALGRPSRRKGTSRRTNHHHHDHHGHNRDDHHHDHDDDHHHHHQSKRSTKSLSGRELAATFMRTIKAKTLGPEDDGAIRRTLASETSGGSDGTASLGLFTSHAWTAPMHIITLGRPGESAVITPALKSLAETHGTAAVLHNVRATPGVDISEWPRHLDVAEYAVSGILAQTEHPEDMKEAFKNLPWLDVLTTRDPKTGGVTDPDVLLRQHHFGCLFAHLAQWQLAADSGNKHTFIFESDGFLPGLLAVPVAALGDIQHQAPGDYDIVFLHHPGEIVGPKVKEFRTALGDVVELYEYNEPKSPSGLSGYLVSDRFVRKIQALVASRGADMVDAWLMDHLCRPLRENDWAYDLPHFEGANDGKGVQWGQKYLNCYKAMTKGLSIPSLGNSVDVAELIG